MNNNRIWLRCLTRRHHVRNKGSIKGLRKQREVVREGSAGNRGALVASVAVALWATMTLRTAKPLTAYARWSAPSHSKRLQFKRDRCKRSRLDKAKLRLSRPVRRAPDFGERNSISDYSFRRFARRDRRNRAAISATMAVSAGSLSKGVVSAFRPIVPIQSRLARARKGAGDPA